MKQIVYKKPEGENAKVYAKCQTLKEAKKILADKYYQAVEHSYDELVGGVDGLTDQGKTLQLFNNLYFIEKDDTL